VRIRNNKKSLIVNKEYSRLPYWTDEGYEDVQQSVSQKYVQDTYGAFAESENQLPYLSDADYQGLEYKYQNPEFFNPTDLPDVDFTDTVPKGTCYELWTSIFGHGTGAFIPSSSQWAAIKEYEKLCPVIYVPHICCLGMKISGPTTLTPGEEAYYSVSGGAAGCAYEMKASGGTFVGTKYFAPMTPGTYEIYVTPEMSNDRGDKCATLSVTVTGGCDGKIGYTTLQMSVGGSQTLTVTGSSGGTYSWATTSGSIVPTEGTSVTYTAPATNANCASNPTITLTCGGDIVGSITIAVNAYASVTAVIECTVTGSECIRLHNVEFDLWGWHYQVWYTRVISSCTGDILSTTNFNDSTYCFDHWGNCSCAQLAADNLTHSYYANCLESYENSKHDNRTTEMKEGGCCPSRLL
jgi:hypothetical protein